MEPRPSCRNSTFWSRRAAGPQATSFEGNSADLTGLRGLVSLVDLYSLSGLHTQPHRRSVSGDLDWITADVIRYVPSYLKIDPGNTVIHSSMRQTMRGHAMSYPIR
jgi:hypothetical protein